MRVTFILPTVGMSGGIKVVAIYAKALAARGHVVRLVSPPAQDAAFGRKVKSLLKGKGWPRPAAGSPSHLDGAGLDHRVLERWRPVADDDVPDADVVVATWWETAEWVAALGPRKGAKVYFIQGHEIFPYLPLARCRATYKLPLHKIVIARWLADVMHDQYGDDVVDLVPNSVDPAQFFAVERGKQATPTAGFLYSRIAFKGAGVTFAALSAVREKIANLRIVSFGSEPPVPELPLPAGAEFFHSPRQEHIRDIYAQCDVWVTASRSEGFNLPAMEAMACRTPIVSTRAGWPEEAIESGVNGILTAVDDVAALARGVEWTLTLADAEWRALSQRAYATARAGSWEQSARKFEDALVHACRRAARGEIAGAANSAEAA